MRLNDSELRLFVKNKPITEYPHQGQLYVEGRTGSEFEIEIVNHTHQRVSAIVSVDGLSVLDGQAAGSTSPGYLLGARETLRIPGWTLNDQQVAKFVFSDSSGSYAAQASGGTKNCGVIGVLVYAEKVMPLAGATRGIAPNDGISLRGIQCSAASVNQRSHTSSWFGSSLVSNGINTSSATATMDSIMAANNIGTGFGNATQFQTRTVEFQQGDMLAMMVLYYDDRKGLRRRGIRIERPSRERYATAPQAFPAMTGCKPPPGWKA